MERRTASNNKRSPDGLTIARVYSDYLITPVGLLHELVLV